MNIKQLALAVIVLLALVIVSYSVMKKDSANWKRGNSEEKQPLLKDFDVNKVAKIAIATDSGTLTLAVKNGKWAILDKAGYPADFKKISDLILTVRNLKVAQYPRLVKSQFASLKLVQPEKNLKNKNSGALLTFSNADGNEMVSLLLGDKHMPNKKNDNAMMFSMEQPDGRYVMLVGSDKPALVTDPLTSADSKAEKWLDKSFVKITNILSIAMRGPKGKLKWELSRKNTSSPWSLNNAKKDEVLKPMVMRNASSVFDRLTFDDVLPPSTPVAKTGLNKADVATIKTTDGFTYVVKLAKKDDKVFAKFAVAAKLAEKRAPGKAEKPAEKKKLDAKFAANKAKLRKKLKQEESYQNWIYVIPSRSIDKLLKKRSDFITPPKKSAKKNKK